MGQAHGAYPLCAQCQETSCTASRQTLCSRCRDRRSCPVCGDFTEARPVGSWCESCSTMYWNFLQVMRSLGSTPPPPAIAQRAVAYYAFRAAHDLPLFDDSPFKH